MRSILAPLLALVLAADGPPVQLPPSPAARSFAGVGPGTEPRALDDWLEAAPWLTAEQADPEAAWTAWSGWLATEAAATESDPAARAGLLAVACRQARWADAWSHFERLGGHPDWQAAMTPLLVPGAPLGHPAGAGGRVAPLPDRTLLRPALPPETVRGDDGRVPPRVVRVDGVTIGAAVCDLVLEFEGGGVTLDVYHRSGGSGVLLVDLPMPADAEVFVDYVDWDRQDVKGAVMELVVEPREEEYTLYRRLKYRRSEFPAAPDAGSFPAAIRRFGLEFVVSEEALVEEVRQFAAACSRLLEIDARVREPGAEAAEDAALGTRIAVPAGAEGRAWIAHMASAVERLVLEAGDGLPR